MITCISLWLYLQIGYLKKNGDGALLFSVVNSSDPEAEGKSFKQTFLILNVVAES